MTLKLIFNKTRQTKNFKQSLKLLNYQGKIRPWFLRTSGDTKKLALKIKDKFKKPKNGQLLKLSCSSRPLNNTGTILKKFQKLQVGQKRHAIISLVELVSSVLLTQNGTILIASDCRKLFRALGKTGTRLQLIWAKIVLRNRLKIKQSSQV